jgi:hypothetical protein
METALDVSTNQGFQEKNRVCIVVTIMKTNGVRKMDDLIKSARLDEDGTLRIELIDDLDKLDKINRVIAASGVWCKMFYMENVDD